MAYAISSQSELAAILETTIGTTPSTPEFTVWRMTSNSLNIEKDSYNSEERRVDRQLPTVRHGMKRIAGTVDSELSYLAFRDHIRHVLRYLDPASSTTGNAQYVDGGAETFAYATGPDTITRSAGSWIDDGFLVNMMVRITAPNNAANAAVGRVSVVTALVLTFDRLLNSADAAMNFTTDAAAAAGSTKLMGNYAVNGTTDSSFSVERKHGDITTGDFDLFTGVKVNTWNVEVENNSIVTMSFECMGYNMVNGDATADNSGTYTNADSTDPVDSFSGNILEGGSSIGYVTSASFSVNNNVQEASVVGSDTVAGLPAGQVLVEGNISVLFQDNTMLNKFINETASSLELALRDSAGNEVNIWIPKLKYTGGSKNISGDDLIALDMPFTAYRDTTTGNTIMVNMIPAIAT